jgi:NADPH-dependent 2,4-dienoyl-CoA reductase/sulfur reductase-like enzyme/nitrite reductase/ring-hydroxylating ferredoxin subunit
MSEDSEFGPDLGPGFPLAALSERGLYGGTLNGDPVVVVKEGGRLCAFSGKCTHMGAPLKDGVVVGGTLRCPWHHARFSLHTGDAVAAPAFRSLSPFRVREQGGSLFVERDRPAAVPKSDSRLGRVVIVGGGAAGFACADLLTRSGFGASVTVISDDGDKPYDRTQCSKDYLAGLSLRQECFLEGSASPDGANAAFITGRRVRSLDLTAKQVELDGGQRVPFDSLVLATGCEPKRLDTPGLDRPNVYTLRSLRDADAIIGAATAGKRALVIGASFIGLEVAASLCQRKVAVDVVAPDEVPLNKVIGPDIGRMLRGVHEKNGVRFHLGRKARSFDGRVLELDDGSRLEADFIVLGVGVAPRVELADTAGLVIAPAEEGGGVVVNSRLETSLAGVYAIGDIARYPDRYSGKSVRIEHWVHAERQGQHVARVLMGQADAYCDLPFFWSAHFDTGLLYLGRAERPSFAGLEGSIEEKSFIVLQRDDAGGAGIVICNRDRAALTIEARWEESGRPPENIGAGGD